MYKSVMVSVLGVAVFGVLLFACVFIWRHYTITGNIWRLKRGDLWQKLAAARFLGENRARINMWDENVAVFGKWALEHLKNSRGVHAKEIAEILKIVGSPSQKRAGLEALEGLLKTLTQPYETTSIEEVWNDGANTFTVKKYEVTTSLGDAEYPLVEDAIAILEAP